MSPHARLLTVALLLAACNGSPTNVGGNLFDDVPATDLGTPSTDQGSATDVPAALDVGTPDTGAVVVDAGAPDTGDVDAGDLDAGAPDAGDLDVGTPDVGVLDTGTPDVGVLDSGAVDVGVADVGVADVGVADNGAVDSGPPDVGVVDAGCVATTEVCNGLDDDCNGVIDEGACGTHLLITELVTGPADAEYVEVFNPTAVAVDLSNVYLSDSRDYACYVGRTCTPAGRTADAVGGSDFVARFPAGATLAPGAYAVLGITRDVATFAALTGVCPTYYFPISSGDAGVPLGGCLGALAMRPAITTGTAIGGSAGLTNGGEPVTLFQWDGVAPVVTDLDYVFYGTSSATGQVDKTGLVVALPADGGVAGYLPDTAATAQQRVVVSSSGNADVRRCDYTEGAQLRTGGNGLGGSDETSERFTLTWRSGTFTAAAGDAGVATGATPGAVNNCR